MDDQSFRPDLSAVFASVDSPLKYALTGVGFHAGWRERKPPLTTGQRDLILSLARSMCLRHPLSIADARLWTIQTAAIDTVIRLESEYHNNGFLYHLIGLYQKGEKSFLRGRNQHHIDPSTLRYKQNARLSVEERHRQALELAGFVESLAKQEGAQEVFQLLMPELLDTSWHNNLKWFKKFVKRNSTVVGGELGAQVVESGRAAMAPYPPGFECIAASAREQQTGSSIHQIQSLGHCNSDDCLETALDPFERSHVLLSTLLDFAGNVALLTLFVNAAWAQQSDPFKILNGTPIVSWIQDSSETCQQLVQLGDEASRGGHMQTAVEFYSDALRHAFADPTGLQLPFVDALIQQGRAEAARGGIGSVPRLIRAFVDCQQLHQRIPRSRFHAAVAQLPYLAPQGYHQMWSDATFVLFTESPQSAHRGAAHTLFTLSRSLLEVAAERLCKYDRVNTVALWTEGLHRLDNVGGAGPSVVQGGFRVLQCLKDRLRERWADERGGEMQDTKLDFGVVTRSIQRRLALSRSQSAASKAERMLLEKVLEDAAANPEAWLRTRRSALQGHRCGQAYADMSTKELLQYLRMVDAAAAMPAYRDDSDKGGVEAEIVLEPLAGRTAAPSHAQTGVRLLSSLVGSSSEPRVAAAATTIKAADSERSKATTADGADDTVGAGGLAKLGASLLLDGYSSDTSELAQTTTPSGTLSRKLDVGTTAETRPPAVPEWRMMPQPLPTGYDPELDVGSTMIHTLHTQLWLACAEAMQRIAMFESVHSATVRRCNAARQSKASSGSKGASSADQTSSPASSVDPSGHVRDVATSTTFNKWFLPQSQDVAFDNVSVHPTLRPPPAWGAEHGWALWREWVDQRALLMQLRQIVVHRRALLAGNTFSTAWPQPQSQLQLFTAIIEMVEPQDTPGHWTHFHEAAFRSAQHGRAARNKQASGSAAKSSPASATNTATASATNTATASATNTATAPATNTATKSATNTATKSATNTATTSAKKTATTPAGQQHQREGTDTNEDFLPERAFAARQYIWEHPGQRVQVLRDWMPSRVPLYTDWESPWGTGDHRTVYCINRMKAQPCSDKLPFDALDHRAWYSRETCARVRQVFWGNPTLVTPDCAAWDQQFDCDWPRTLDGWAPLDSPGSLQRLGFSRDDFIVHPTIFETHVRRLEAGAIDPLKTRDMLARSIEPAASKLEHPDGLRLMYTSIGEFADRHTCTWGSIPVVKLAALSNQSVASDPFSTVLHGLRLHQGLPTHAEALRRLEAMNPDRQDPLKTLVRSKTLVGSTHTSSSGCTERNSLCSVLSVQMKNDNLIPWGRAEGEARLKAVMARPIDPKVKVCSVPVPTESPDEPTQPQSTPIVDSNERFAGANSANTIVEDETGLQVLIARCTDVRAMLGYLQKGVLDLRKADKASLQESCKYPTLGPDGWSNCMTCRSRPRLVERVLPMHIHLADGATFTHARMIALLVVASTYKKMHCVPNPVQASRELTLAMLALSYNAALLPMQRCALDVALRRLIEASESLRSFHQAFPWLRIEAAGAPGSPYCNGVGELTLLRLRRVWTAMLDDRVFSPSAHRRAADMVSDTVVFLRTLQEVSPWNNTDTIETMIAPLTPVVAATSDLELAVTFGDLTADEAAALITKIGALTADPDSPQSDAGNISATQSDTTEATGSGQEAADKTSPRLMRRMGGIVTWQRTGRLAFPSTMRQHLGAPVTDSIRKAEQYLGQYPVDGKTDIAEPDRLSAPSHVDVLLEATPEVPSKRGIAQPVLSHNPLLTTNDIAADGVMRNPVPSLILARMVSDRRDAQNNSTSSDWSVLDTLWPSMEVQLALLSDALDDCAQGLLLRVHIWEMPPVAVARTMLSLGYAMDVIEAPHEIALQGLLPTLTAFSPILRQSTSSLLLGAPCVQAGWSLTQALATGWSCKAACVAARQAVPMSDLDRLDHPPLSYDLSMICACLPWHHFKPEPSLMAHRVPESNPELARGSWELRCNKRDAAHVSEFDDEAWFRARGVEPHSDMSILVELLGLSVQETLQPAETWFVVQLAEEGTRLGSASSLTPAATAAFLWETLIWIAATDRMHVHNMLPLRQLTGLSAAHLPGQTSISGFVDLLSLVCMRSISDTYLRGVASLTSTQQHAVSPASTVAGWLDALLAKLPCDNTYMHASEQTNNAYALRQQALQQKATGKADQALDGFEMPMCLVTRRLSLFMSLSLQQHQLSPAVSPSNAPHKDFYSPSSAKVAKVAKVAKQATVPKPKAPALDCYVDELYGSVNVQAPEYAELLSIRYLAYHPSELGLYRGGVSFPAGSQWTHNQRSIRYQNLHTDATSQHLPSAYAVVLLKSVATIDAFLISPAARFSMCFCRDPVPDSALNTPAAGGSLDPQQLPAVLQARLTGRSVGQATRTPSWTRIHVLDSASIDPIAGTVTLPLPQLLHYESRRSTELLRLMQQASQKSKMQSGQWDPDALDSAAPLLHMEAEVCTDQTVEPWYGVVVCLSTMELQTELFAVADLEMIE